MTEDLFGAVLSAYATLSAESDYEKLLEGITRISQTLTGAGHATMTLLEGRKLKFAYSTDLEREKIRKLSVPVGEGLIGKVAQEKTPLRLKLQDTPPDSSPGVSGITVKSLVCVPMLLHQETFGTIQVINKRENVDFNETDISRLQMFANQAALAIERFCLQDRLLRESRRVHGIFEALTDGIMVVDAEGNPVIYNKAIETLFFPDGKQNYALTTYLSTLLHEDHLTGSAEVFLLKPHNLILSNRYVVVKDAHGKPAEVILSIRNITDQTGTDRRYSQFYAIMLRYSNRLTNRLKRLREPKQRRQTLAHQKDILRNLVFLTDLKSGPLRIEKENASLPGIYQSVKQPIVAKLARAGIGLQDGDFATSELKVRIEPGRFRHVFRAILKAAYKKLPHQSGSTIRLSAVRSGQRQRITAVLSGQGIDKKLTPANLEWNRQIDQVITGNTKEIDFDLAYARHIIQAHKGDLTISANDSHCTVIDFDFIID
jgi:PAS domain-containing protein